MAREDFVTTTDEEERAVLERYLSPRDRWYPSPSNMVLVVDPAFVPDDLLKRLLSPGDGRCVAMLTERPFEWYPPDKSKFKVELRVNDVPMDGSCGLCGRRTDPGGLDPFWEDAVVCGECTPDELKELQRIGYERATESSDRTLDCPEMAWWQSLVHYAMGLEKRERSLRSASG